MAQDIDIDYNELARYIETLEMFHRSVGEDWKTVRNDWERVSDTWQGPRRIRFEADFVITETATTEAFASVDNAVRWLSQFKEILDSM